MTLNETEVQALQQQVMSRMVNDGTWAQMEADLASRLAQSGWNEQLSIAAQETARAMAPLNFDGLQAQVKDRAYETLTAGVKQETLQQVSSYVRSSLAKDGSLR